MEKVIESSRLNLIYLNLIQNLLSNQTLLNQELHSNLINFLSFYKTSKSSIIIKNLIHALLNSDSILIENIGSKESDTLNGIQNYLYKLEFIHQVFYESYLNRSKNTSDCLHQYHLNQFVDQCTLHHHPLHPLNQSLIDSVIHTGLYNAIITSKTNPNLTLLRFLDQLQSLLNRFDQFDQIEECSIIWIISKVVPFISIKELDRIKPTNRTKLINIMSSEIEEIIITKDYKDKHPLYKTLGPISISFGSLLRSIGYQENIHLILTSLNSINNQCSNLNLDKALGSSTPIMFSVLGILIGPVYLRPNCDLLIVCLKLWIKIFHLIQTFGKSQFDGLVWDGIINGIKGLNDQDFGKLIRWLDPWNGTEKGKDAGLLVYLSVLENCMERVDVIYVEENVVEKLWKEIEIGSDVDTKKDDIDLKFESVWKVLISIIKYRKLREDEEQIIKFVDRMMDLVSSNQTNKNESKNDKPNEILEKETLKVVIQTIDEEINWNHIIKRLQKENQYEKLIEVLKYIENQDEFIKVCKLLKEMMFEIDDSNVKIKLMIDWFEVVSQVGWVGPVKWWIHQFGGINGKALAKL